MSARAHLFDKREAASIGREAFFEPDIFNTPESFLPPTTSNFSILKLLEVLVLVLDPYIYLLYQHMLPLVFHFLLKKQIGQHLH